MQARPTPTGTAALVTAALALGPDSALALRELSTDRPDRTESPYTVDRRHFQVELDAFSWTEDRQPGARDETLRIITANLKLGIGADTDLQAIIEPYDQDRIELTGVPAEISRGVGDLTLRLKHNFTGNDGGEFAIGIMPFVQFPLEDLDAESFEGGVILPVAHAGPWGLDFGAMGELDIRTDDVGQGHHAEMIASATTSRSLFGTLGGFVEIFSLSRAEAGSDWVGTFDTGLTLGVGDSAQLDAGCNIGLSDAAEDLTLFVGLSWRH